MNASQMINALTFAEVDSSLESDTRRMMRDERIALTAATRSGDKSKIAAAMAEASKVAEMWGVALQHA